MRYTVRTDLAMEATEAITRGNMQQQIPPGVFIENEEHDEVVITRVEVTSAQGEQAIGKPKGKYITLEARGLRYKNTELQDQVMKLMAKELADMALLPKNATVLVVGLGNWNITPDALGPKVIDKIVVTRHLQEMLSPELKGGVRSVCAIAPGVLGLTGMETAEIIGGIASRVAPQLIICVDALAAASSHRVTTTIQLTDTGIHPGSGVGNKRFGLSRNTLGVPVIAVGVPTVVHAAMIANDTIDALSHSANSAHYVANMQDLSDQQKQQIVREVLPETMGDLMVTPKEVDSLIADISTVVAGGINQALHPSIDYQNIHMYLNFN